MAIGSRRTTPTAPAAAAVVSEAMAEPTYTRPRPVYINISRKLIVNTLQAYIARNILGEEAFYKLLLRDDETLRKARDIVNKGEGYPELPAENQVPR